MNKLALIALAATAAILPAGAQAQVTHGGPNVVVRHHGAPFAHPGPDLRHRRLQRGFFVHPFWFGPQFHVRNWQTYGFAPPPPDHRWIRYYDDAHLIDRRGRVMDSRHGLDWDQYGERWEMEDGIPSYYGRGDWHPGAEDYAWVESQRTHEGYVGDPGYEDYGYGGDSYGYGPPAPGCHPAPQRCGGYPQGGGYGSYGHYGYGYGYPIIIETTVTTGGGCGSCEVVEYEREVVVPQRARRYRRPPPAPPPRRHEPPPPRPGERG